MLYISHQLRSKRLRLYVGLLSSCESMIEVVLNDRLGKKIRVKCKCATLYSALQRVVVMLHHPVLSEEETGSCLQLYRGTRLLSCCTLS